MNSRYSVIVPVYNSEKTLVRCISSLIDQRYPNVQIILVNDGSTDSSDTICCEFAAQQENILYISKENGGVSSARNVGLDAATGKYVTFVDSDDYVCADYFQKLDSILMQSQADLILFSHRKTDGVNTSEHQLRAYVSENKDAYFSRLSELIYKKTINTPWDKIYRRDLIQKQNLRFHERLSIGEDRLFNIAYALGCESLCISDLMLYTVSTENEHSLSRRKRDDLQEQFKCLDEEIQFSINQAELQPEHRWHVQAAINFAFVRSVYSDAKRMHLSGALTAERRAFIREKCQYINSLKLFVPGSTFCRALGLPVRLRLVSVIDAMGWQLARKAGGMVQKG